MQPTAWPDHYKPIERIKFKSIEEMIQVMRPNAEHGLPLIFEGTDIMNVDKWANISHIQSMLKERHVLVKKSPNSKFRYFDLKKNSGNFVFQQPLVEEHCSIGDFMSAAEEILRDGRPERMYLQETLSGHDEMAEEFGSWRWDLLVLVSSAFGWGLPDSNELFIGMPGVETPLHFDERENLFFQVRGRKEIVVFPFTDYPALYPFPTTHPCDRQSMVGDPRNPDVEAFPKFQRCVGHHGELQAGDLLYLPYGWWHWLRNLDHLTTSVSFWSTTPPNDFSRGLPSTFSPQQLTRVRRNLESLIAQAYEPTNLNETMLSLADSVKGDGLDPRLDEVRKLLTAVKVPPERQDDFIVDMVEGRFGIDWNRYV